MSNPAIPPWAIPVERPFRNRYEMLQRLLLNKKRGQRTAKAPIAPTKVSSSEGYEPV